MQTSSVCSVVCLNNSIIYQSTNKRSNCVTLVKNILQANTIESTRMASLMVIVFVYQFRNQLIYLLSQNIHNNEKAMPINFIALDYILRNIRATQFANVVYMIADLIAVDVDKCFTFMFNNRRNNFKVNNSIEDSLRNHTTAYQFSQMVQNGSAANII